ALLDANPVLQKSFDQQLIISFFTYNWSYTNLRHPKLTHTVITNLESAGFLLRGFYNGLDKHPEHTDSIFGNPYSQYVRGDFDYRAAFNLTPKTNFVARGEFGKGFHYGNSEQLPYIKQFYSGGSNGLRGWHVRTLGPGAYLTPDSIRIPDNTGDIKLEMNLEYRFTIFSFFKGALFTDAGNVWLQSKDPLRPGGEFQWNQFLLQFGVDVGAGLRMDFSYFILRFDLGMPVRDPTTYKANK